jgi:Fe-S-cluster containining protein
MSSGTPIVALVEELVDAWLAGREPDPVSTPEAVAIARGLHREMDRCTASRDRDAAARGLTIACRPGCAACCDNLVMVFRGEAIAVADWLAQPANRDARDAFLAAYPRWRSEVGDSLDAVRAADQSGDDRAFAAAATDVWRRGVRCAFNADGLCTVYPVRPNACRNCHAVGTADYCRADGGRAPSTVPSPQVDELRHGTRPLVEALHVATGGERGRLLALCEEVHRLLGADATAGAD